MAVNHSIAAVRVRSSWELGRDGLCAPILRSHMGCFQGLATYAEKQEVWFFSSQIIRTQSNICSHSGVNGKKMLGARSLGRDPSAAL